MKTIWKFKLNVVDKESVVIPQGAQFLDAQMQGGVLTLWAVVDPHANIAKKTVYVRGTGHDMPEEDVEHIGTVQERAHALVWHVFIATK